MTPDCGPGRQSVYVVTLSHFAAMFTPPLHMASASDVPSGVTKEICKYHCQGSTLIIEHSYVVFFLFLFQSQRHAGIF